MYTSYQVTAEGVSRVKFLAKFQNMIFWQFFKICNFVLFWLGIWCEPLVWVIMGWQGRGWGSQVGNAGVLVVLVILVFREEGFQTPVPFQCWGTVWNRNTYLYFIKPLQRIKGSKLLLIINYRFPLYEKRKIFLLYALRMTLERYDSRLHAASTLSHVYYLQPLSVSDVTGIEHYHHEKTQQ